MTLVDSDYPRKETPMNRNSHAHRGSSVKSRFSNEEWHSIVLVPFLINLMFDEGANLDQKFVFQADIMDWKSLKEPIYKEICENLADENWHARFAKKFYQQVADSSIESILKTTLPSARTVLSREYSETELSEFFGNVMLMAYRHGASAGTGHEFGSAEKMQFLANYFLALGANVKNSRAVMDRLIAVQTY